MSMASPRPMLATSTDPIGESPVAYAITGELALLSCGISDGAAAAAAVFIPVSRLDCTSFCTACYRENASESRHLRTGVSRRRIGDPRCDPGHRSHGRKWRANPHPTGRFRHMIGDTAALYEAFAANDPRFDRVFYMGVTSTGIYCRPVCTARTPKASNCRFFDSAEAAEKARFRPCLRCRPELAPGNAPVDDAHRVANLIVQRIHEGMLDAGGGLERVATSFGWSSRQIRRMVQKELGVSPMELVLTRRLLLAKQLLTETKLPMTEVAFSSGFSSLRRFNDAFGSRYGMPPSR